MTDVKKCALCLNNTDLVKSHIYPEFQYKPLYDAANKYFQISTNKSKPIKQKSKGIYEYLLCKNCDNNIIGGYEDHASKVLFGDGRYKITIKEIKLGFMITNVDYKKFKLFQISLLWRTAASKRPEIPSITLGPHYERMRNMLLNGDPGKPLQYGCKLLFTPRIPEEFVGLIHTPEKIPRKLEGNTAYRAIFNGIHWIWLVSGQMTRYSKPMMFINEKGELPIINSGKRGWEYIMRLGKDLITR